MFMGVEKTCRRNGEPFLISDEDLLFYRKISPVIGGKEFAIPLPSLSPEARLQRRLAFRNERDLYRKRSALSGKEVISIFSPDSPYNIYTYDEWWSDKWDALSYGREYDPGQSFSDQLLKLSLQVPHCPLYIRNGENSDYTNYALNMKDCYLVFGATDCDRCLYSKAVANCRDVIDCLAVRHSELCYEGSASERCYNCQFFSECFDCTDCLMLEACDSCRSCALCFGLHRKEYCILNEHVGKLRYEEFLKEIRPLTRLKILELRNNLQELSYGLPHRQSYVHASDNCEGDNISHSRNCFCCFDATNCEDSKYLFWTPKGVTSHDCCFNAPDGVELCYEACSTLGSRCMATFMCWNNDQGYYLLECHYSKNIFGCVGLRRKEYCILNKQYTADQYEALLPKIINSMMAAGEWGEFLADKLSYFGYNETIANEYFPLTQSQARNFGFNWRESGEPRSAMSGSYLPPETIAQVDDVALQRVLLCSKSGKPFKITPLELSFYRRMGLPLPELSPDVRHALRLNRRNKLKLWKRNCAKTGREIWTTFAPDSPYEIYSNEAYVADKFA